MTTPLWPYPNIIVDEAQDLSDTLLEHLATLMEITEGVFYTFYDRNQAIMKKEPSKWIDEHADCRLVLPQLPQHIDRSCPCYRWACRR